MNDIIIIGAGMGGLAAGIYGQRNGFSTAIYEAHSIPGGQCTCWKRNGFTFDPSMHSFNGFKDQTKINSFWKELGALPCQQAERKEFVSAYFPDGTTLHFYNDVKKLENHLKAFAPEDAATIGYYLKGLKSFCTDIDWFGINYFGSVWEKLSLLPFFLARAKYFKYTLLSYSKRFKNPFLRQTFPLIRNSISTVPLFAYLAEHGAAISRDVGWPVGGGLTLAKNMAETYLKLGGSINYRKGVRRILTKNDKACGVELEDGTQYESDFVISNADGRKTITDLLSGKYTNKKINRYCEPNPPDAEVFMSVQVFLGVNRDLSSFPSAMILFLKQPVAIGDHEFNHLDIQLYGFDKTMAPEGKGVIKVELPMKPSHFLKIKDDKEAYRAEKNSIAEKVIRALEQKFQKIRNDIEEIDVTTLHSWERYMGGSQGFNNFPNKHRNLTDIRNVVDVVFGLGKVDTLPGLKNFFFAGQWVTSMGSVFTNASSGREVIQKICKQCNIKFSSVC